MTESIEAPQKASEVKAWLAAHPQPDPAVLAPQPKQKAAAKVAAVRALTAMGGPAAFDVLSQYASDGKYSDAMLKELHAAWDVFDRREFALAMFNSRVLRLDVTKNVEGLQAVPGLQAVMVIVPELTDLSPLAECRELRELDASVYGQGTLDLSFLPDMPSLEILSLGNLARHTDFAPLARTSLKQLTIGLNGQPGDVLLQIETLERLQLSGNVSTVGYHDPGPTDVDPGLIDVVVTLVQRGVKVAVYRYEKNWVPKLVEAATAAGLFSTESNGYVALTNDASELDMLTRRLFVNQFTGLYL